jgi:hypothetical protein
VESEAVTCPGCKLGSVFLPKKKKKKKGERRRGAQVGFQDEEEFRFSAGGLSMVPEKTGWVDSVCGSARPSWGYSKPMMGFAWVRKKLS